MSRSAFSLLFASALGLSMCLPGCGGSADPAPVAATHAVRLEGCVVDQYYVPDEGVPVRVVSADGRLVANARSGRKGEFVVQLPVGLPARMAVDRDGGEELPIPALDRDQVVDACLVARQ